MIKKQLRFLKGFGKRFQRFLIIFFVGFVGFAYFFVFGPFKHQAGAAWFNDNWGFRKEIPITAHTAAETNKYIAVTLSNTNTLVTNGQLQSDCGDFRFTKQNGELLPYYIVSGCNSASTVVHVNFDTFPAGAQTTYVYYGNPSVTNGFSASDFSSEAANYTIGTIGSEEKGPSPVAYWKFDDAQGTSVANSITAGSVGTTDGTWQTQDHCLAGMCLLFNGTSQEVTVPYAAMLNNTNFTLSTWVNWAGVPTGSEDDTIIERGESGTDNYNYYFFYDANGSSAGSPSLAIGFSDASGNYFEHYYPFTPTSNTWYNLVVTMDDDNNTITFFVNGKRVLSTAETASPNTLGTQTIAIARNVGGDASSYLKGFVDEYKIYNFVLSEEEVKTNFNARSIPKGASVQTANSQNIPNALSNGLVGYWKMDETSWTNNCSTGTVLDASGNGNNGRACPNSTGPTGGAIGKYDKAGDFDGSNDYVAITNNTNLQNTRYTHSFWMYADNASGTGSYEDVIGSNDAGQTSVNYAFQWRNANGAAWPKTCMQKGAAGNYELAQISSTMNTGTWYFVTCTYDGENLKAYLNGNLEASVPATDPNTANAIQIAANGVGSNTFNGKVDEFRIYNRALSSTEVSQLYNWAPGPVGYWQMNEGSWTNNCSTGTVLDASGNGINGVACPNSTGPTGNAVGKFGKGGSFDGTNDYVAVTGSQLQFGTNMTISAWIYPRNIATNQYNTIYSDGSGSNVVLEVIDDPTRTNTLTLYNGSGFGTVESPDNAITLNTWQYVSAVIENGTARLYVNGIMVATGSFIFFGQDSTSYLGSNDGSVELFNGSMDDVKIYNYPRTTAQIIEDMNSMQPAPGGSAIGGGSSAVGYWKFNEGYSTVANSSGSCGANCVGTLTGMSSPATATSGWTNNGKFDKALSFDGSNDYVTMGSNDIFAVNGPFTISAWVNPTSFSGNTTANAILGRYDDAFSRRNYLLYTDASGQLLFQTSTNASCASGGTVILSSGRNLSTGIWSHVAGVYDGTYMHTYINGKEVGTPVAQSSICTASTSFAVGVRYGGGSVATSTVFSGRIDEPKFYRQALTGNQIKIDYNRGASQVAGALSDSSTPGSDNASTRTAQSSASEYCIPGDSATCTSPTHEYKFEEKTSTTNYDTGTGATNGTMTSGPTFGIGKTGAGVNFDGSNDYITFGGGELYDETAAFSISGWVYIRSLTNDPLFVCSSTNANTCFFAAASYDGGTNALEYCFNASCTSVARSTNNVISLNRWYYVAMTYDGSANCRFYVNGIDVTSVSACGEATGGYATNMGGVSSASVSTDGVLDTMRIYDYVRTPAQMVWEYNKGGPVAYWKLDECSGTTLNDASGNGNIATLDLGGSGTTTAGTCQTLATAWGTNSGIGKRNYALTSDGVDDAIIAPSSASLSFISTGGYSAGMWINPTSISSSTNGTQLIRKSNTGNGYRFYINSASKLGIIYPGGSSCGSTDSCITPNAIPANSWTHVFFTYKNGVSALYINGVKLKENSGITGITSNTSDTTEISAGTSDCSGFESCDFNGRMDDIRVYNYDLTPMQVKTLYNQGTLNYAPVTGAP